MRFVTDFSDIVREIVYEIVRVIWILFMLAGGILGPIVFCWVVFHFVMKYW